MYIVYVTNINVIFLVECQKSKENSLVAKDSGLRVCGTCYSTIKRGSNHSLESCRSKSTLIDNLSKTLPEDILEKIAVKTLKEKVHMSGDNTVKLTGVGGGKPVTITVGKVSTTPKIEPLSVEDVINMQTESNLSWRYEFYLYR